MEKKMEIILSTRNASKIDQIKPIFTGLPVTVLTLEEAGVQGDVVEDGKTLEQNAIKKAMFGNAQTGKWTIAEDTGFYIDFLGGRPGIHAARWVGENKTTEEIRDYTLLQLKVAEPHERYATFKTVAAVVSPSGQVHLFAGQVRGSILKKPRGKSQPNMPYSSIFVPIGQKKVWAEMTVPEENALSHRGKAFRQVRNFLERVILLHSNET